MKFLHAADIHLDSPLRGLAAHAHIPPEVTEHCTRRAFANLIDLAIAEDVAFLIIAGDLYDGDWRDHGTGLFFAREMRRLGRPCYLIRGNHDAQSVITRSLQLPPNVREFSSRTTESFEIPEHHVVLHGRSFPDRDVPEDLSQTYPAPRPGWFNIGVLHTSAEDPGSEHATYAPCRIDSLTAKAYDYWALGHIHQRQALHRAGDAPIIFPGNIQGRHARETGAKGATLVTVENGRVSTQHIDLDVLRWETLAIDVTAAQTPAELFERVRFDLAAARDNAGGRPLIVRLTLRGTTPCHAGLLADPMAAEAECRAAAEAVSDQLFIEKLVIETAAPEAVTRRDDDLADLRAAFLAALDQPAVRDALLADFQKLDSQIPADDTARARPPRDVASLSALAEQAWAIAESAIRQANPA